MTFESRAILEGAWRWATEAADRYDPVKTALGPRPTGRVIVAGAGKAAARMAQATESAWNSLNGAVVVPAGYEKPLLQLECLIASHPISDSSSTAAADRILDLADLATYGDQFLFLVSGGASSLLHAPVSGVKAERKQALTRDLTDCGASIAEINIVRTSLSRIKRGKLAHRAAPAHVRTLVVSDVAGDDPTLVGSGPTIDLDFSSEAPCRILRKYRLSKTYQGIFTDQMNIALGSRCPGSPTEIVLTASCMLTRVADNARKTGLRVQELGAGIEGEVRTVAGQHFTKALAIQSGLTAGSAPVLLLSGGECTVTKRGSGLGGPNAGFASAFSILANDNPGLSVLACDTDGIDGLGGIAGAFADQTTLIRARNAGLLAAVELENNNAHGFFQRIGDSVISGPTFTNPNDFRAVLIQPPN